MRRLYILAAVVILMLSSALIAETETVKVADFTLNDLDGNPVTISELEGLIILDFWATWCPPCRVEIPFLQDFYDEFHEKGLQIVGISTEDVATQKRFVEQMIKDGTEMTYHLLLDPEGIITRKYGVEGIPTTIFVKDDLTQIEREVGFAPQYAPRFREIIETNLPE